MPGIKEKTSTKEDYRHAAEMLQAIAQENGIDTEAIAHEAEKERLHFVERFAPEQLLAIPDGKLLGAIYHTQPSSKDYMMYHLEAQTERWGSIRGGSSHKFGLFQRKKDHHWINASGHELTEAQALAHAKDILEKLILGAHFFESLKLSHREEIENLDTALQGIFGNSYAYVWIQKYFALLYPDKVSGFYSLAWQNYVLYACGIPPMSNPWARSAQIAAISRQNRWEYPAFYQVFVSRFGTPPKNLHGLVHDTPQARQTFGDNPQHLSGQTERAKKIKGLS